jgi:DNA helicase IV
VREKTLGNYHLTESPTGPGDIRFVSLQSFKGLEADALIVAEVDRAHVTSSAKNLYVATSRAKHVLIFLELGNPGGTL